MKFSWKGGELHRLRFKYTRVHVWVNQSELVWRGVLKHELRCTWVETAQGTLCRQVLWSRACEAEENLYAKCTECSFNPNVNEEVAKYPNADLARQGVLCLPQSWQWYESVKILPLFWSTSYEYTNNKGNKSSLIWPVIYKSGFRKNNTQCLTFIVCLFTLNMLVIPLCWTNLAVIWTNPA